MYSYNTMMTTHGIYIKEDDSILPSRGEILMHRLKPHHEMMNTPSIYHGWIRSTLIGLGVSIFFQA